MSLWLTRAGSFGEYEEKFLTDSKIYLTWDNLEKDLSEFSTQADLGKFLMENYQSEKPNTLRNWSGQLWPFVSKMQKGDWVVLPSKRSSTLHFGEITGDYKYNPEGQVLYQHYRTIKWFAKDISRSLFDQDILYSIGAFLTICQITRNDAENRIKNMYKNNWKRNPVPKQNLEDDTPIEEIVDLEKLAIDQIANLIGTKFKGHLLAILVDAILQAKGYVTYCSPAGPDKGVDILAAPEPMGFGNPRLCVQVKSGDTPVDRPTLDQLIGSMQNFNADQGLLVSWSGFKSSVTKELPQHFFRVRLWDQENLISELLANYDKLDVKMKAMLPIKQIWTLSNNE